MPIIANDDAKNLITLIDLCVSRAAFRGDEIGGVALLRRVLVDSLNEKVIPAPSNEQLLNE